MIYLRDLPVYRKNSKVEIKSDVAVNLSGKRLPGTGRPCKRKSWFDHHLIIKGCVYVSSIVTSAQPYWDTHMYAHIHE